MTKSPTARLLMGLLVTLVAVTVFSWYALSQLRGLRKLQKDIIDRTRHDSLLLVRVQNDVNTLGLTLRAMTVSDSKAKIAQYRDQFDRVRKDLESAIQAEAQSSPLTRQPDKQAALVKTLEQFWQFSDNVFGEASRGNEQEARYLAATQLWGKQSGLTALVSRLLERNNRAEERADKEVADIYLGVERNIYAFLAAVMVAIVGTSLYLTYSNRRIFEKLEWLSSQRRILAGKLITVQEEVLRSVSRELHDEFGQILTAVGTMLARAERRGVPPESPLRLELSEVREITHNTLEKMRSLSQMLHPTVLDDYGLANGIEWYAEVFDRQTGVKTRAVILGERVRITGQPAIHCFRVVQEALNNAVKHSGTKSAEVEAIFSNDKLTINVKDFGCGISPEKKNRRPGLGLIAMQERANLVHGKLNITSAENAGTVVSLEMPLRREEAPAEATEDSNLTEIVSANYDHD